MPMPTPPSYREHAPGPALAGLVECFWTSQATGANAAGTTHRVWPDGCMDVLFDFTTTGGKIAALVGTMSRPQLVAFAGPIDLLGVRFRPGGLTQLLPLDAAELLDTSAEPGEFGGRFLRELGERLRELPPTMRVARLRDWLTAHRSRGEIDPYVRHCVDRIEASRGGIRLAELERSTGLSERQIERKFHHHLGLPPKTFARIIRFRQLAAHAAGGQPNWARLAVEFGYADQAHLVREFTAFAGLSPGRYQATGAQNVGFVQYARQPQC